MREKLRRDVRDRREEDHISRRWRKLRNTSKVVTKHIVARAGRVSLDGAVQTPT